MAYEHRVVPPVAVVAHGSGSCADFVARAFADPLREAGYGLVTFEDRTGDICVVTARLAALVDEHRAQLVGGVSLGAHAAVHVAASRPGLAGVLLVMPAWTGPPGTVAALSSLAADELEVAGLPSVLERLRSTPDDAPDAWVAAELASAWPSYQQVELVQALLATSRSAGPSLRDLAAVDVPAGIVALESDAFHPLAVAREWAGLVPTAALTVVPPPVTDRAALGRAAVNAWRRATGQGSNR